MSKTVKIVVALVAVLVVAAGIGFFLTRADEAPPPADLDAIDVPAGSTPPGTGGAGSVPTSADGTWAVVAGEDVFVGYRIDEVLAAGARTQTVFGRTPAVEGTIAVEGDTVTDATFTADLTQLASDNGRRDDAIGTRGLQTETFPDATFVLTEPITLPAAPTVGEEIAVSATGDLTLHGVTRPVTLELTAQWTGSAITVAGSAPVVLADFGIETIDIPGLVTVEDNGTFELQLLLQPA